MKVLPVDNWGVVVDRLAHMLGSLSFARVVNQLVFSCIQQLGVQIFHSRDRFHFVYPIDSFETFPVVDDVIVEAADLDKRRRKYR